jgi:methionine sulfoxide reductase heme-binding subunit
MRLEDVPWLASRSAGIVASLLLSASVIVGLLMSTRALGRGRGAELRRLHEPLAVFGLGALALHGALLLLDRWLDPGLTGVLVPFVVREHRLFTGLGVLAGYGAIVAARAFYLRRRIGVARARRLHLVSLAAWALAAVHALGTGSDRGSIFLWLVVVLPGVAIVALLALRIAGAGARPAPARRAVPAPPRPAVPTPAPAPPAGRRAPAPLWGVGYSAPAPREPASDPPASLWQDGYRGVTSLVRP